MGYQLAYKRDLVTAPSNNGNAVILQVAFSYDTLVESREVFYDTDEEGDGDGEGDWEGQRQGARGLEKDKGRDGASPVTGSGDVAYVTEGREGSGGLVGDAPRDPMQGFFGSAVDILGMGEEISGVWGAYDRQREAIRMEGKGRAKRRVFRG